MAFPPTTCITVGFVRSICGATLVTPGAVNTRSATLSILSAATTIWVGSPSPPGKCVSSSLCPTTDSGLPVNVSTVPSPSVFKVVDAKANIKRTAAEITQALRGFLSIVFPTFDQRPDNT